MHPDFLSELVITDILSINTIFSAAGSTVRKTNRPCWAILLKYEGETEYLCNGRRIISNAHNMVLLPKGSSYEWHCTRAGHYFILEFECSLEYEDILTFPLLTNERILKIFQELEYRQTRRSKQYKLECLKGTYEILLMLINASQKTYISSDKKGKIQPVLDYIARNYNRSLTNDELAALTPFSTVYLRKLFKEITGNSPITYQHFLRIHKAKEMLKSDYGSIANVAESIGYTNIYEFSKMFKKYTGLSPTQYAKSTPGA